MSTADTQLAALEQYAGSSPEQKGMPGPLELSRMHEAELRRCYKQYGLLGALISQIMVGRVVTVSAHSGRHKVTRVKLKDGKVELYGLPYGTPTKKKASLLCETMNMVTVIEGAKP